MSRIIYICALTTAALLAVLFETGVLPAGACDRGSQAAYRISLAAVAMTLIAIPLALKWQRIKAVDRLFSGDAGEGHHLTAGVSVASSVCRICVLYIPLVLNVACYYLFGREASFGYMALMLVVAFAFVWPKGAAPYNPPAGKEVRG